MRFRNTLSGVVVDVSDDRGKQLDAEWESVQDENKTAAKKTAAKKSTSGSK